MMDVTRKIHGYTYLAVAVAVACKIVQTRIYNFISRFLFLFFITHADVKLCNGPSPFHEQIIISSFLYLLLPTINTDNSRLAVTTRLQVDGHSRDQCPVCSTCAAESERSTNTQPVSKPEVTFVLASSCNQIAREMNGVETPSYRKMPGAARCAATFART